MSVLGRLADPAKPMPDKAAPAFKRAIAAPRPAHSEQECSAEDAVT